MNNSHFVSVAISFLANIEILELTNIKAGTDLVCILL